MKWCFCSGLLHYLLGMFYSTEILPSPFPSEKILPTMIQENKFYSLESLCQTYFQMQSDTDADAK